MEGSKNSKIQRCASDGCDRKGYWIETGDNGEHLFCFKVRHRGEWHTQKLTLSQLSGQLKGGSQE